MSKKSTAVPGNPFYKEGGNFPSKTGNSSGNNRGNNPPKQVPQGGKSSGKKK